MDLDYTKIFNGTKDQPEPGFLECIKKGFFGHKIYAIERVMLPKAMKDSGRQYYDIHHGYVEESAKDLAKAGYIEARGFLSKIKFTGTKCYIRFWGFEVFNVWSGDNERLIDH